MTLEEEDLNQTNRSAKPWWAKMVKWILIILLVGFLVFLIWHFVAGAINRKKETVYSGEPDIIYDPFSGSFVNTYGSSEPEFEAAMSVLSKRIKQKYPDGNIKDSELQSIITDVCENFGRKKKSALWWDLYRAYTR